MSKRSLRGRGENSLNDSSYLHKCVKFPLVYVIITLRASLYLKYFHVEIKVIYGALINFVPRFSVALEGGGKRKDAGDEIRISLVVRNFQ